MFCHTLLRVKFSRYWPVAGHKYLKITKYKFNVSTFSIYLLMTPNRMVVDVSCHLRSIIIWYTENKKIFWSHHHSWLIVTLKTISFALIPTIWIRNNLFFTPLFLIFIQFLTTRTLFEYYRWKITVPYDHYFCPSNQRLLESTYRRVG